MTIEELSSVLQMQEEILQFSSFTNADAWELGNLIVAEAAKRGAAVLVRIRLNNGYTVFQYGMDGTNLYHEQWLTRKENTVRPYRKKQSADVYGSEGAGRKPGKTDFLMRKSMRPVAADSRFVWKKWV